MMTIWSECRAMAGRAFRRRVALPGRASATARGIPRRPPAGRSVVPVLLFLTLLAGVTTQASAQTLPTVSFASASQRAGEGSGTHNVEVRLNPAPTAAVTLTYTVGGTATAGSDFTIANSGTLAVPAGAKTATIPVTIIDDTVPDAERVVLKLAGGTDYDVGSPGTHTLVIDDNEPNVSFASASRRVGEGSGMHDVEVRLSPAPTTDITLNYLVRGTALAGWDFKITNFFRRLWPGTSEKYGTVTVPAGAKTATIPVTIIDDSVHESDETIVLVLFGNGRVWITNQHRHTLTIVDNERKVSFASASQSVGEGSGTHNVGVTLNKAPTSDITVKYTVGGGGTARAGSDFTIASSGTLTVLAGAKTATFPVTIIDDSVGENSETVVLKLAAGESYQVGNPGMHTLTIVDDEPVVSFASASQSVGEGSGTHNVGVTLSPAPITAVTFTYTVGGTAAAGSDFTIASSGTVTVPMGATTAVIPVTLIEDSVHESDETVVLTLAASGGYHVVSPGTHTLTIRANDGPTASFASASQSAGEGSGTHDVEVRLNPAPTTNITLGYTVGGTATAGSDFTIASSGTVTVLAGATTATIPVTVIDDSAQEGSETVVLKLTGSAGYKVGSPGTHTLIIAANDASAPVSVSFAEWGLQELEWSGTHDVKLTLNPAPAGDITLTYKVSGTATPDEDYTALPGTLLVPAGATTAVIPVTIIDDTHEDNGESVALTLVEGPGYKVRSDRIEHFRMFRLHILNDDVDEPAVTIAAGTSPVTEGGSATFTLTADPAPAADLPVTVTVAADGDYGIAVGERTVTLPTSGSATLTLATTGDDADEPHGSVTVTVKDGNGYTVGASASGTVTIQDDDAPALAEPSVTIAAGTSPVTEGGDAVFTLTATPAPAADLAVSVTVASGGDWGVTAGSRTVTIPTSGSATLTLATAGDDVDEPDGSVSVTVTDGDGYTVGSAASGSITIQDDDEAGTPVWTDYQTVVSYLIEVRDNPKNTAVKGNAAHIAKWNRVLEAVGHDTGTGVAPMAASEIHANAEQWPDSPFKAASVYLKSQEQDPDEPEITISAGGAVTEGSDATFTLTANPAPAADLAVSVTVASDGDWGVAAGSRTVTIPTSGSATLTLATAGDDTDEPDGSVTVTVDDGSGYTVGSSASGTVAVQDDDGAPACTSRQSVADILVAVRDNPPNARMRGNAAHIAKWNRVLEAIGHDTGTGLSPMAASDIHANAAQWPASPFKAASDRLNCVAQGGQDQDQPQQQTPEITVTADAASVTEGGDAVFTIAASPAPAADLQVDVTVAATGDYGLSAGTRTVTIPTSGSATLTLATAGDATDEPDGSVTVTVADGSGWTAGDPASGTVAIRDDDAALPEVTIAAGAAVTEGGNAVFTLTASPAPAADLAVSVSVAADGDYGLTAGTRTVTIPTTGSATLTLATTDDAADEPDGSVTATVQAGSGYTVGAAASGTVAVRDDDLPPPVVTVAAKAESVTEGGDAVFTLTADRAPDADLTVTLAVSETGDGDHVAASDEGPATVTIPKDATEASFTVPTVNDAVDEPDTSATVTVQAGTGYTAGDPASASVAVKDDDAPALPVLSVADETAKEGEVWLMPFTVRLSAPASGPVEVRVDTRPSTPVSAEPGPDYFPKPVGGHRLTFRPGETERTVEILILDDSHDEEAETFEFVLSDAKGAVIGDGVAVGTIVNDDPMPAAWLARFGRTVAEQALDGIAGRMAAPRTAGMQGAIAGQAMNFDPAPSGSGGPDHGSAGSPDGEAALAMAEIARGFGNDAGGPGSRSGTGPGHDATGPGSWSGAGFGETPGHSRTMTARDALLGSSFSLTGQRDGSGGSLAFWGRAAQGSFDGREGTFSLDGTVTTGMLGADYARGRWLIGLALAQSDGEGDYRDTDIAARAASQDCPPEAAELCRGAVREGDGTVEASLTAAIPYAAFQASERLKLWGAAGYGTGEVTLKTELGGNYSADTSWSMAAAGMRGDLLAPPVEGSGPALAATSDALWARTSSEKTDRLAASESDATRLRVGLEGSYHVALEDGASLVPKLEVGARHDGGDAETGFGVELGGGIAWTDPGMGLSLDLSGRTLIAHGNDDLKDRGFSAALAYDPAPATQRGASLSLRQDFGGRATGGLDALFQPEALEDRAGGGEAASRWAVEAAYGLPVFGGRWTGSPHVGFGLATGARDYSLGWRLAPEAANAPDLSFGVKATRRESDAAKAEHSFGGELIARW